MKRLLALALLSLGCDATEPTLYVPDYDPSSTEAIASTEFCALLARNTCAVLRPCCSALPFAFDEAKCRQASRAQCEARRQKSMELGLIYDDVQAGRCVRGTAILLPDCRSPSDPIANDVAEACKMVFHGGKKLGEACKAEIAVDCAPPALGVRVLCSGSFCRERITAGPGEPCDRLQCSYGYVCEGEPRVCTARFHPLGAECTPAAPELDRCDVTKDRYCKQDAFPQVCATMPTDGELCSSLPGCAKPWRCDVDRDGLQRCTEGKTLGQVCADERECASKLCAGRLVKVCMPGGIKAPIASMDAKTDPEGYVTRIAAACSGIIPDGAGSLAAFELPQEK